MSERLIWTLPSKNRKTSEPKTFLNTQQGVSNRPVLGRIISILLDNPDSTSVGTRNFDFKDPGSHKLTEQRKIFLLIYSHNVCHTMTIYSYFSCITCYENVFFIKVKKKATINLRNHFDTTVGLRVLKMTFYIRLSDFNIFCWGLPKNPLEA